MPDQKINDLVAIAAVLDTTQFETDTGGITANKATGLQTKTYVLLNRTIGTDIQAFGDVLDDFNILGAAASDGQIIVATGAGAFAYESGTTLRTSIGCKKVGKETLWIPATGMTPATTSGPATGQIETSSEKVNIETLDFDATADEFAHFNIAMPKSWNLGTVTYQVFWSTTAADTDGVAWALQAVAVADGDVIDVAYGTAIVVTDDAQTAAGDTLVTDESAAVTIAGSPADDEMCYFRLLRDISDANDDMTEDAQLLGIKLFFTLDAEDDA